MASSSAQVPYLDEGFDSFFAEMMEEWKIPGASVGVVDGNDIFTKGYGSVRLGGLAVNGDTLFNAGSMSKSFTAGAVALLVDDNKNYPQVQWNTSVSELLRDDFMLGDLQRTQDVTITDILSHRTGMARHDDASFGAKAEQPDTPRSITRRLRNFPPNRPLRTHYQYNNMMFTVASYLVETVSRQTFAEVLQKRFWGPLGMDRTYLGLESVPEGLKNISEDNGNIAAGFHWDKKTASYLALPDFHAPEGQGAGNIISSARDWAQWIHAMIQGTAGISAESMKELVRPRILITDDQKHLYPFSSAVFCGMGWKIQYYRGYRVITHAGGIPGHSSWMMWLPELKWGCVLFGNAEGMDTVSIIVSWSLLDQVLDIPKAERTNMAEVMRSRAAVNKEDSEEGLFPHRPNPPLPMQLSLAEYAGSYHHFAYRELTVEVRGGQLFADVSDRTFGFTLEWKHLSGADFIVEKELSPKSSDYIERMESTFEVGASGKVERMGIDFLNDDEYDSDYIWFVKAS